MIALLITTAALLLLVAAMVARVTGRIGARGLYGLCAIATGVNLGPAIFYSYTVSGPINAVAFALNVWLWWHNGGGDDTKRRLSKAARRFQGVRRTAPSATRVREVAA
ncbi:hypothetical protein MUK60_07635 [Streptomyces sp. LRE541]|uniref:hypothetical protein n=1 Tax=Streptomyces sp. LRE541 TaxID=2931983 RepID=UPI002010B8FD|nr:hypothetical protein [Streptomyces sp. LRE541]UPZ27705.1 hypothetical protein MUK60_07635 [Streptomyces sp. LRE541]